VHKVLSLLTSKPSWMREGPQCGAGEKAFLKVA